MKKLIFIGAMAMAAISIQSCKEKGCTDKEALNYTESAQKEDGSCVYKGIELDMDEAPNYYIVANGVLELKPTGVQNATSYFQERLPYTFGNIYQVNNLGYFINLKNDDIPIAIGFATQLDSGWVEVPELKLASYQPGFYQFAQEITPDENEDKFIVSRTTNGVAYSSAFGAQKGSTIEILEARKEDYLGMDAIKLHLRINCKLYNVDDDTDIIDLTETEVTISIVNEVI